MTFLFLLSCLPVFPVQTPVLHGFGNMIDFQQWTAVQVRDGAGHFQQSVIGTGRKPHAFKSSLEQSAGVIGQGTEFPQLSCRDPGVAGDAGTCKPLLLYLAGGINPDTDGSGVFAWLFGRQLLEIYWRDLHMQIHPIQQRAGNPGEILPLLNGRAGAGTVGCRKYPRDRDSSPRSA